MRLILLSFFTILGANLMISMLNSDMTQKIQERNAALERLTNPPSNLIK